MINTQTLESSELIQINGKEVIAKAYARAGIPAKYYFTNINTSWSTEFSLSQKLTGSAKILSQKAKVFVSFYIKNLDTVLSGGGLSIKQKNGPPQIVKNLVFEGGKDSGKTLLLSLISQGAVNKGYKVLYLDWVDFFNKFQTWESASDNSRLLEAAKNCDLLCFDSIYNYSLNPTPSFIVLVDSLIVHRKNNDLVTNCSVVTSENGVPSLGPVWNQFIRENFTIKLPETDFTYENNSKRNRTKNP